MSVLASPRRLAALGALVVPFSVFVAVTALVPDADAEPIRRLELMRPDAGSAGSDAGRGWVVSTTPADPPAMLEKRQWIFDLRYQRGEIFLVGASSETLAAPQRTPRAMGRFALELFEGPALIERVRFDFPLLGAGERDAGHGSPPSWERKLSTRIGVVFPATKRGTRLELRDRATGQRWGLPWPPLESVVADGGAEAEAGNGG